LQSTAAHLISRDAFYAPELEIFHAVHEWTRHNQDMGLVTLSLLTLHAALIHLPPNVWVSQYHMTPRSVEVSALSVMSHVRLPLLKRGTLLSVVRPSAVVSFDDIMTAIKAQTVKRNMDLKHRGLLSVCCFYILNDVDRLTLQYEESPGARIRGLLWHTPSLSLRGTDVNVARPSQGAQVVEGELKQELFNGATPHYDLERGFTRHSIEDRTSGIVVQLGVHSCSCHLLL
jgi:BTB/POZ domain-containing protein 9